MKKTFDCGHKGKGKFCHRCANGKMIPERLPSGYFRSNFLSKKANDELDKRRADYARHLLENGR